LSVCLFVPVVLMVLVKRLSILLELLLDDLHFLAVVEVPERSSQARVR